MLFNGPPAMISPNGVEWPYPNHGEGGRGHSQQEYPRQPMLFAPVGPVSPSELMIACGQNGRGGFGFPTTTTAAIQQTKYLPFPNEALRFHEHYTSLEDRCQLVSSIPIMIPEAGYGNMSRTDTRMLQSGIPFYHMSESGTLDDQTHSIQYPVNANGFEATKQIPTNGNFKRTKTPPKTNTLLKAPEPTPKAFSSPKRQRQSHKQSSAAKSDALDQLWMSPRSSPEGIDGLEGERRLIIKFQSFGTKGRFPQTFGKRPVYVPDGLIGTHTAYDELWKFEIHHTSQLAREGSTVCCLTWRITNVKSGDTVERTETSDEAESRSTLGWTIASKTFREALHRRANQLEESFAQETNPTRLANLKSLTRTLRPKTFTQGPLVFGLKHRIVQEKLQEKSMLV